jgi:hypothetical protein
VKETGATNLIHYIDYWKKEMSINENFFFLLPYIHYHLITEQSLYFVLAVSHLSAVVVVIGVVGRCYAQDSRQKSASISDKGHPLLHPDL